MFTAAAGHGSALRPVPEVGDAYVLHAFVYSSSSFVSLQRPHEAASHGQRARSRAQDVGLQHSHGCSVLDNICDRFGAKCRSLLL